MIHNITMIITSLIFVLNITTTLYAAPYGPTLNELVHRHPALESFHQLTDDLSLENINIRLGMSKAAVEQWAALSRVWKIVSYKDSKFVFKQKNNDDLIFNLQFEVWLAKGEVVVIKTYYLNNFEGEEFLEDASYGLKGLKEVRVNECWVNRNYIDPNSLKRGYDFVINTQINKSIIENEGCMGSDRANVTIGKPGLLYPKYLNK
ncbi:MAG: hypothetical protein IJU79_03760 [Desulfovibrionaceae bacterium]|nr:hypothetical protein [Desulfovibrionaceae bacterium]